MKNPPFGSLAILWANSPERERAVVPAKLFSSVQNLGSKRAALLSTSYKKWNASRSNR
jgi:hypothetical protein